MITETVDRRTVRSALELACRAPSVHNSQPWRWRIGDRSVHLLADLRRWLPATDPDGRDLVLSCGAALHHLRVALAASGLRATVHRLTDPDEPDHLAAVELAPGVAPEADVALAAAITRRRSDRRGFSSWEVPEAMLAELTAVAAHQGAVLTPVTDGAALRRAVAAAAAAQDRTPGYATETTVWTGRETGADGIPAANLLRGPGAVTGGRFATGTIDRSTGVRDGALLAVLGTASDDTLSQLRAGEALSAVTLHATTLGLASCPLTQVLEVDATRRSLRDDVLGGAMSPQVVLRLGWGPQEALPPTPRRRLQDVVEPFPDR